jgi:PAS domain S-box-containing protein
MSDSKSVDELDFKHLVEMAPDPIAVHERGVLVYVNAAGAALVGAPDPAALLGRSMLDFVAPELHASVQARARELAERGGAMPPTDEVFLRLDGSRVEVETSGLALGGGRTLVVIRDVSRRVRAEAEKRVAESRLRAFFEVSDDAMAIARDGRYDFANPAFARLFGYSRPEEVVGLPLLDLFAPSERPRIVELARRRAAGEPVPATYLSRGLRGDGTEFDAELRAFGFKEAGASFTAAIVRDVTEQRAYEVRLQESERRYRELFDLVPVSLFEIDATPIRAAIDAMVAHGVRDLRAYTESHPELVAQQMRSFKVIAVNAAGLALVGARTLEELLANRERIYPPESYGRYREMALQLAEGRTTVHFEGWIGTLGGDRRWIETAATLVPGHEASWGRLLFASIDVTEKRRVEEERAALQERLRQAEKLEAVGRLAGGVAHDFNNILSGILGYAELTSLALQPGSDLHEHQLRIREAALRARDLVRQILTFSRRDRGTRRTVDVPTVVREAMGLMKTGIPSSATLDLRIDPEAGATLADPTQVHQIVLNLCANARDAIGTYGRIEVAVEAVELDGTRAGLPAGPYVRLRVRDDGVGMEEETLAHLFEPFLTTKGPFGGHGLGLAVVHGIVGGVGGGIQVESAPGKGSTFDVYLPRVAPEPSAERPGPARAAGRGERILVVDDEPMVRSTQKRILEGLGYAVEAAADGQEALDRFRAAPHAYDLVLTDQTMPRLSGLDLARAILAIRADARVILCTGYSDQVDEALARRLGLRSLLAKPFDRESLSAEVQRALGKA